MKRTLLRDLLFGLLGAMSLFGGIILTDLLFDDSAVILPESETSFVIPPSDAAAPDVPGAILTRVEVPAPDPFFEGATVLYPTVFDADGIPAIDAPPAALDGLSGDEGAPGGADQDGSAGDEGSSEGVDLDASSVDERAPGAAAGNAISIIARFFDLCAEPPAPGCPSGIGHMFQRQPGCIQ